MEKVSRFGGTATSVECFLCFCDASMDISSYPSFLLCLETVNQNITPENAWHQDDRHKVSEQVPSPDHTGLSPSEIWYANRIARSRRRRETLAAVVGVCLTTVVGARWYHHYGEDSTTTTTAQDNRPHSSHS